MANSKGPSNVRSMLYGGKNSLLPPKSPFPSISPSYGDYIPNSAVTPKPHQSMPRDGNSHQRTSSESLLMVEQPSWLDELLDEPETPVRRGHRRSSSDSFAYIDSANSGSMSRSMNNYMAEDDNKYKNVTPVSPWYSSDFEIYRGAWNPLGSKSKNKACDVAPIAPSRGLPSPRGNNFVQSAKLSNMVQDTDGNLTEKKDLVESGPQTEKKDSSNSKSLETDSKRAKQQFAQRSRVRKLQYIAELERNVQALQAEGSEVSAELEFLNQQSLILSMENKALKQRLENLAQEQLIKYLEHEVLEREVGRLRGLYQQQKQPQPQPTSSSLRRTKSRDLDQQFANLSLKHSKEARDSVSGQVHM